MKNKVVLFDQELTDAYNKVKRMNTESTKRGATEKLKDICHKWCNAIHKAVLTFDFYNFDNNLTGDGWTMFPTFPQFVNDLVPYAVWAKASINGIGEVRVYLHADGNVQVQKFGGIKVPTVSFKLKDGATYDDLFYTVKRMIKLLQENVAANIGKTPEDAEKVYPTNIRAAHTYLVEMGYIQGAYLVSDPNHI
jgi:hypothetical protein